LVIADASNYYIYGPSDTPVEQISLATSAPTYLDYVTGSQTYVATNLAGDLLGFWGYDAYGNLSFGTPDSPFGYAGQYMDAASGLSNMRARFYQSQTGEFTTRDPLFAVTDTAYGYANGDGVNGSDPTGMDTLSSIGDFLYAVGTSPGTGLWHAMDSIYQNGANNCSGFGGFFSAKNIEDTAGFTLVLGSDVFIVNGVVESAAGAFRAVISRIGAAEAASGSTSDLLSTLAAKAQVTVGEGSGPVYGTAVHSGFAAEINALGGSNLSTEISYLDGEVVPYGTTGSVRLDVVEGDILEPQAVFDLKTGTATLTPARIMQIRANLPLGYQDVPIAEIRP